MPRPKCGVPRTMECLQDLRQAANLLLRILPGCTLFHSLMIEQLERGRVLGLED